MNVLYFAYGSCMSPEDLSRDVADFELIGPALVRGFRLGFTRYSRARRGGVADLVPDMAGVVEGVLYRLPVQQLTALDEREGAPDNYRRDFIAVRTPDGRMYDGVLTYVVTDKSREEIPPHPDYVATIFAGADAFLSPHYVEKLRSHVRQLVARKGAKEGREQDDNGRRSGNKSTAGHKGGDGRNNGDGRGVDHARRRSDGSKGHKRRTSRVYTYRLVRSARGARRLRSG